MDGGVKLDKEVKHELEEIEQRLSANLHTLVTSAIATGFKDVKDVITELFNKDIGFIREWQNTFKDHHRIHFAETVKLRNEITGMRDSMTKEMDEKLRPVISDLQLLDTRQTIDETATGVKEKVTGEKQAARVVRITVGLTVAGAAGAFIMWLIEFISNK